MELEPTYRRPTSRGKQNQAKDFSYWTGKTRKMYTAVRRSIKMICQIT